MGVAVLSWDMKALREGFTESGVGAPLQLRGVSTGSFPGSLGRWCAD